LGDFGLISAEFNVGLIWLIFFGCSGLGFGDFGGDLVGAWGSTERVCCGVYVRSHGSFGKKRFFSLLSMSGQCGFRISLGKLIKCFLGCSG
jgi:hypothetical protein